MRRMSGGKKTFNRSRSGIFARTWRKILLWQYRITSVLIPAKHFERSRAPNGNGPIMKSHSYKCMQIICIMHKSADFSEKSKWCTCNTCRTCHWHIKSFFFSAFYSARRIIYMQIRSNKWSIIQNGVLWRKINKLLSTTVLWLMSNIWMLIRVSNTHTESYKYYKGILSVN